DDLNALRKFYADRGYFDARVQRGTFEVSRSGAMASVSPVVQIDEGERYVYGNVEVRGARLFSQADVIAPFASLTGQEYDAESFAAALVKLQSLYDNHGLLTTRIEPLYTYDAEQRRINVLLNITEHNRIY